MSRAELDKKNSEAGAPNGPRAVERNDVNAAEAVHGNTGYGSWILRR